MSFIAGIDEAGRGPVIGPMVMAIAAIDESLEFELSTMGVTDSKLLSVKQRLEMAEMIRQTCFVESEVISPAAIDEAVRHPSRNLNILEAEVAGRLIDKAAKRLKKEGVKHVILDCPSVNPAGYLVKLRKHYSSEVRVITEHKADLKHVIVGAASIIAKTMRDAEIEKLKKLHNVDFGSGYPGDAVTASFVREHFKEYDFFRTTWETYKRVAARAEQKGLGAFGVDDSLPAAVLAKQERILALLKEGFVRVETKMVAELLRVKGPGATITLYRNGRVLVQGRDKEKYSFLK